MTPWLLREKSRKSEDFGRVRCWGKKCGCGEVERGESSCKTFQLELLTNTVPQEVGRWVCRVHITDSGSCPRIERRNSAFSDGVGRDVYLHYCKVFRQLGRSCSNRAEERLVLSLHLCRDLTAYREGGLEGHLGAPTSQKVQLAGQTTMNSQWQCGDTMRTTSGSL